ncbi:Ppx/GppA family phosphatase [Saccharopolyspora sp. HNM0983]|uniref:Ppx/GppA family phosphatase n=1 Tax=Saccharopolyspora montiporae TaxID=2781240 RepID=A0A929BB49_9PSEU|nr:Ppx/GppA phosphatase family protein [Saccharopolyspora sp. HNM0983]MBE9374863.1 Ppx/GppA family phosphatase [Saccharopolyspora sp. HNM0983]
MRLGVLDVGSNTVHLLVVDARRGGHPTPMTSEKTALRLAERIGAQCGRLGEADADELIRTVQRAREAADRAGCDELLGLATSAIREADNSAEVLDRLRSETGVQLEVLPGTEEARLTFLAARRWYGWSAGNLLLLDIGGGSLEMAVGIDEEPAVAESLPLGAGRMARQLPGDPPGRDDLDKVRGWLDEQLAPVAERFREAGAPDRAVATSKTFRTLARLTGAAAASAGPRVPRTLTESGLHRLLTFITRMGSGDLATLDGVSSARAHQLVGGALVAEATMRALSLRELDICPWALREGVILRRLDRVHGDRHTAPEARSEIGSAESGTAEGFGLQEQHGTRWDR